MKIRSIALCALTLLPFAAEAADGFYVSGSIGYSLFRDDSSREQADAAIGSAGATVSSSNLDRNDVGYKVQVGYQFNDYFAVEAGYVDLGKEEYTAHISGGRVNVEGKASGYNLDAVGSYPFGNGISLFGKFGLINAEVKVDISASGPGGSASDSESVTKVKQVYGVGVAYELYQNIAIRAEAERYANLGAGDKTGETDVDLFSVGVSYRF
jgi:OOP family OmpA-OmpF porin